MTSVHPARTPPKLAVRIAVTGMTLAVLALGALAVWAAVIFQNGADGLSQAGVQTSGHLRAVQALSMLDTSSDALEQRIIPAELANVRRAERVLDDALDRMQKGGIPEASRIAGEAQPLVARLTPAIEQYLARASYDSNGSAAAEERMDDVIRQLQVVLNDLDPDPSRSLTTKLAAITTSERTIRRTAFVLIPLGLGGVAACGWLLSLFRRRAEATMRGALAATTEEARTDQLTGLPNRRALLEEFDRRRAEDQTFTLVLSDLNGFKRYNDTFGHLAGDALLRRLGRTLALACGGRGLAARLGGDEFCVLLSGDVPADAAHALIGGALCDEGEGFRITAAAGIASVPAEARDASAALRLADTRMYAAKVSANPNAEQGIALTLMRMLDERHPGLGGHGKEVASLAVACAEKLGLCADDVRWVERAAELHDVGKVGIPSAILTKPGPLNEEEWEFMRRHSVIGERILGGVPSLERVASMIRSTHERWDGRGYPDELIGEEIPIGARIVGVADAFCAMTEERPYAQARSRERARQELRACSGTQFDPDVVVAFLATLDSREALANAAALTPAPA